MTHDWQSWAAPLVVLITAGLMAYRLFARKKPGCGRGCGCSGGLLKGKKTSALKSQGSND